jgi:acetylglutamate kinase
MKEILVIKIGGNIIDDEAALTSFLEQFSKINQPKILIHGGGKLATQLSSKLNIETKMIDGRRITDAATIKVVTMVYAGFINKNIVAKLQSLHCDAIGLSGADAKLIQAHKRQHPTIDFGFVGDIDQINTAFLLHLLENNYTPIIAPICADNDGNLLNTNADTIASSIAVALSKFKTTNLFYCFEKKGLLLDINDKHSCVQEIEINEIQNLIDKKIIVDGMIPKVHNIENAIILGVHHVTLCHAEDLMNIIDKNSIFGTTFKKHEKH